MREKWFWPKQSRRVLWVQGVFLILIISAFTTPAAAAPAANPAAAATPASIAPGTKAPNLDRQMLEETVNKALERQLAPVKEMLTDLTIHRTTPTDIIGGIGYILGLFGLAAYFLSKRKNNP
jgi:nickel transport protein